MSINRPGKSPSFCKAMRKDFLAPEPRPGQTSGVSGTAGALARAPGPEAAGDRIRGLNSCGASQLPGATGLPASLRFHRHCDTCWVPCMSIEKIQRPLPLEGRAPVTQSGGPDQGLTHEGLRGRGGAGCAGAHIRLGEGPPVPSPGAPGAPLHPPPPANPWATPTPCLNCGLHSFIKGEREAARRPVGAPRGQLSPRPHQ